MQYEDNELKYVIVVNKRVNSARLLNAVAHLSLGWSHAPLSDSRQQFYSYVGPDENRYASISHWPVIVLKGNGNQLKTLREQAALMSIPCQSFVDTMLGSSAEDQLRKSHDTPYDQVELFAVILFGATDQLHGLTRKFSLFTGEVTLPASVD